MFRIAVATRTSGMVLASVSFAMIFSVGFHKFSLSVLQQNVFGVLLVIGIGALVVGLYGTAEYRSARS